MSIRMIIIPASSSSWVIAIPAVLEVVISLIATIVIRLGNLLRILETSFLVVVFLVSFWRFRVVGLSQML